MLTCWSWNGGMLECRSGSAEPLRLQAGLAQIPSVYFFMSALFAAVSVLPSVSSLPRHHSVLEPYSHVFARTSSLVDPTICLVALRSRSRNASVRCSLPCGIVHRRWDAGGVARTQCVMPTLSGVCDANIRAVYVMPMPISERCM
jgi:hypothetical protein